MRNNIKKIFLIFIISIFAINVVPYNSSYATTRNYDKEISEYKSSRKCASTDELQESWQETCFTCIVVAQLVDTFMNGAERLYPVVKDASMKLLWLGFIIWVAFWALRHLGSFQSADGSVMIWEVISILFKVLIATVVINVGVATIINYTTTPILAAGADYATLLLESTTEVGAHVELEPDEMITSSGNIVSSSVLNKILKLAKAAANSINTLMVIGSSLMCFSIENPWFETPWWFPAGLLVPDFVTLFVGLVIWCIGFMISMSIAFYLLDISFKLGLVVLLLPLAIALWPFPYKETQGKAKDLIYIGINAAGVFIFVAATVSLALVLIENSFIDPSDPLNANSTKILFEAINKDNVTYIRGLFDLTNPFLYVLLFCLTTAFIIIGKAESYADQFFSSKTSGLNPMHHAAKATAESVGKKAYKPAKLIGGIAMHQTGRAMMSGMKGAKNLGASAISKTNQRFVAPVIAGARDGANKGYRKGRDAVETPDAQLDDKLQSAARTTAGVAAGLGLGTVGALKGAAVAGWKNEVANFNNMKNRVKASGGQLINAAAQTKYHATSAAVSLQNGNLKQAFSSAADAIESTSTSAILAAKTAASFTRTTAAGVDNIAAKLQGNKAGVLDANGNRANISRTKAQAHSRDAALTHAKGGLANKAKSQIKELQSTIKHTKANLGDTLSFDKDLLKTPQQQAQEKAQTQQNKSNTNNQSAQDTTEQGTSSLNNNLQRSTLAQSHAQALAMTDTYQRNQEQAQAQAQAAEDHDRNEELAKKLETSERRLEQLQNQYEKLKSKNAGAHDLGIKSKEIFSTEQSIRATRNELQRNQGSQNPIMRNFDNRRQMLQEQKQKLSNKEKQLDTKNKDVKFKNENSKVTKSVKRDNGGSYKEYNDGTKQWLAIDGKVIAETSSKNKDGVQVQREYHKNGNIKSEVTMYKDSSKITKSYAESGWLEKSGFVDNQGNFHHKEFDKEGKQLSEKIGNKAESLRNDFKEDGTTTSFYSNKDSRDWKETTSSGQIKSHKQSINGKYTEAQNFGSGGNSTQQTTQSATAPQSQPQTSATSQSASETVKTDSQKNDEKVEASISKDIKDIKDGLDKSEISLSKNAIRKTLENDIDKLEELRLQEEHNMQMLLNNPNLSSSVKRKAQENLQKTISSIKEKVAKQKENLKKVSAIKTLEQARQVEASTHEMLSHVQSGDNPRRKDDND